MSPLENKILKLLGHISHVREYTQLIGFKLIETGEIDFGLKIIANGLVHDTDKLTMVMLSGLAQTEDKELLATCVKQHNQSNMHHPEYWGGIKNMPDLFVAEMVCDWKARSGEIGTDFKEWIEEEAPRRFNYCIDDAIYSKILKYTNLLLEQPLQQIK